MENDSDDSVICLDGEPECGQTVYGVFSFVQQSTTPETDRPTECIVLDDEDDNETKEKPKKVTVNPPPPVENLLKPLFAIDEPIQIEDQKTRPVRNKNSGTETDHPCSFCDKIFYVKRKLTVHELEHYKTKMRQSLKEKRRFTCSLCSESTHRSPEALQWHMAECVGKFLASENVQLDRRLTRGTASSVRPSKSKRTSSPLS